MAAISSAASGNWSAGATWVGGVAPTSADTVTILNTHTVTLDTTGCVCNTLTINSGGTLTASTTASWDLTSQKAITNNGTVTCDISSNVAVIGAIKYNASLSSTVADQEFSFGEAATVTLKGYSRKRITNLSSGISAGATSATVDDATGWQIGDVIVFATTQAYNATPRTDKVTLTSVAGGNIGWTGGITYDHASGGYVGNFSSNLTVGPYSASGQGRTVWKKSYGTTVNQKTMDNVLFYGGGMNQYQGYGAFSVGGGNGTMTVDPKLAITNSAFLDGLTVAYFSHAYSTYQAQASFTGNVIYTASVSVAPTPCGAVLINSNNALNVDSSGIFRFTGSSSLYGFIANSYYATMGNAISDSFASACNTGISWPGGISNVSTFANNIGIDYSTGVTEASGVNIGTHASATNTTDDTHAGTAQIVLTDSTINSLANTNLSARPYYVSTQWVNKNNDVTSQELYRPFMEIKRDNSNNNRSASSIAIYPTVVSTDCQRTRKIPCANGKSIRVIGYVKKSHATNIAATVAITGLGITPVSFTKANDTNWEQFDLTATNSSGNDGNFTLTYTANSSSGTTNVVYFDGVPDDPFVTKCRHYGYRYDETNPARVVNPTISANEATATAYTGITVTGATSAISLGSDRTFQILYDYTQAWAATTANLAYDVPLTGAGVAGNASLFAVGNVTTTGYTLNGAGSLDMGSLTLTASLPWVYTYTGGVFSQATTVPTFNGGTLNIGAAGTYTFTMAGSTIVSMTPTAPGTYAMGSTSFTGTVDLRNTSGTHAITVELPSGTSYTTANNTGATITVSVPTVSADISITGMPDAAGASCRLQVFNATAAVASAWQATTAYSAGDVRLRTTGVGTENTAGLYMRCTTGGTSGGTEPTWNTTPGGTTADGSVTWTTYKVLFHDADPASTSLTDTYIDGEEFLAGETVTVRFAEMDAGTSFKRYSTSTIPTASGFSVLVDETADEVYATNGLNGSSYESTFSPDFVANYIILDTNTDFSGKAAYAYFCYTLTTSNGMYRFWGGVTALDVGNYRVETDTLNLYFDESAGFVKQTDDVRIFRKDGVRPALDPTTGGNGIEMNWRVPVSVVATGSGVTASDKTDIAAAVLSAAQATPIHSDFRKAIGQAYHGDGSEGDKLRSTLVP